MLLINYRTITQEQTLPIDQRWRTLELATEDFPGLDLTQPAGISAAIRRIAERKIPNVEAIPYGASIYLTNTDTTDHWDIGLQIQKAT
jgi:hypothetical protein